MRFSGKSVVWHSRLGAEGGLARVTIDGGDPVQVSCYAADEIPGWPLFEHSWTNSGDHVLKVEVLGEPDPRGTAARVWLDANLCRAVADWIGTALGAPVRFYPPSRRNGAMA